MASMKAVQVGRAGGDFELVERPLPEPGAGHVRVRVEACGICHSDAFVKDGTFPGVGYPRVPGHEVVGTIDALGPEVAGWRVGQRVGVGWHGGHCFRCVPCRRGDFINCENERITGITYDGGYAEYLVAPEEALALVPEALRAVEAAPLLCAGVTTFNALRNSGARPGDLVAVQGLGGLGHLALQFAARAGFHAIAISRGKEKQEMARLLGAHHYIDSAATDAAKALTSIGGARVILATAPDAGSMSALFDGLGPNGTLLVVGATMEPIEVPAVKFIMGRRSMLGWPSGTAKDSEDTLGFCAQSGVRPMIETFPLEQAAEAYERMLANEVRFRAVLTP